LPPGDSPRVEIEAMAKATSGMTAVAAPSELSKRWNLVDPPYSRRVRLSQWHSGRLARRWRGGL
jgi:hypothetical protein